MQANEVIKYVAKTDELLAGKVLVFDAQTMQSRVIKIGKTTKIHITEIQQTADMSTITAVDLQQGLANNTIELIDVRTEQERDLYDIGGKHIPLDELMEHLHEFHNDKTYVFYCATGKRSGEAVKLVQKELPGVKALSLQGGLKDM
jgi:adenylyltransferase/sulfurtransferase